MSTTTKHRPVAKPKMEEYGLLEEVEFGELPAPGGRPGGSEKDRAIRNQIKQLQGRPGKWALVRKGTVVNGSASYAARGCEAAVRTVGHDEATDRPLLEIWAMWPEDKDPADWTNEAIQARRSAAQKGRRS